MPHKHVTFDPWIGAISTADLCLGRIVKEAVVARDAAVDAGAEKHASKKCRAVFASAENTLAAIKDGRVKPGSDAAWKRASDALRKYTSALDCADPRAAGLAGRR